VAALRLEAEVGAVVDCYQLEVRGERSEVRGPIRFFVSLFSSFPIFLFS